MVVLFAIAVLILYYYFQDKKKEPLLKLVEVFLLGVIIVFQINYIQDKLLQVSLSYIYQAFVVAATTEEVAKFLALKLTIYRDKEFDSWMDGVVYAVVIGLGFGLVETFVLNDKSLSRAITAIPMHSLTGVVMGFYLGLYKITGKKLDLMASVLFPILLHGIYNYTVYIGNTYLFIVYFTGLWILSTYFLGRIRKENKNEKLD